MSLMKHGRYQAHISYRAEIDSFFGEVVNTKSTITFYGKTTDELRKEFAVSVREYLDTCKELGIEPEKPFSGKLTLRMDPEQHKLFASLARANDKSLNAWIVDTLTRNAQELR
ncbi:type II toxin-antitoxin system HicB family antitoxin [Pseudodesulfovibrio tunisiensis]|uniref:type II toxin-antitoxin system HicB family antitoxin n=1 Tax=Pseudodesulfovibrio tunisiensis TaxID=463192 RepID=UPI001FB408D7|nr:type II toxin-antitoxin system HicB family antitoxin [Pseudodesulfovibrio tunisiensis]